MVTCPCPCGCEHTYEAHDQVPRQETCTECNEGEHQNNNSIPEYAPSFCHECSGNFLDDDLTLLNIDNKINEGGEPYCAECLPKIQAIPIYEVTLRMRTENGDPSKWNWDQIVLEERDLQLVKVEKVKAEA
jgi:hypothetical protein